MSEMALTLPLSANRATLVSLGILMADHEDGNQRKGSFVEYFLPFVVGSIQKRIAGGIGIIESNAIKKFVCEDYGIDIPVHAIGKILALAIREKYISKDQGKLVPTAKVNELDFESIRNRIEIDQMRVYKSFAGYVAVQFGVTLTDDQVDAIIIGFIREFNVECLKSNSQGSVVPYGGAPDRKELFYVGKYLEHSYNSDRENFVSFLNLVKGQMLANVLICKDLDNIRNDYSRVVFYLDTTLVLQLLELQDHDYSRANKELVSIIKQLNGNVAIFEHTIDEIDNILHYAQININNNACKNRILDDFRRKRYRESDIVLLRDTIRLKIVNTGITIHPTPGYQHKEYNVDHKWLESAFIDGFKNLSENQVEYDINSIRSIYAIRGDRSRSTIEKAVAIFVTTNYGLAQIASNYAKTHNPGNPLTTVVTDFSLANYSWLKLPVDTTSIPESELLKHCFAMMQPPDHLWDKYIRQIDALANDGAITPDSYAKLRYSLFAPSVVMELTEGEEERVVPQTINDALAKIDEELERDKHLAIKEKDDEIRRMEEDRNRAIGVMTEQIDSIKRVSDARGEKLDGLDSRIDAISNIASKIILWPFAVLICLVLLYSVTFSTLSLLIDLKLISNPFSTSVPLIGWMTATTRVGKFVRFFVYIAAISSILVALTAGWRGEALKMIFYKMHEKIKLMVRRVIGKIMGL